MLLRWAMWLATMDHLIWLMPWFPTRSLSFASSSAVHGPLLLSDGMQALASRALRPHRPRPRGVALLLPRPRLLSTATSACCVHIFGRKRTLPRYVQENRTGDPFSTPWDKSSSSWPADVLRLEPAVQGGRTDASPVERALKPDPQVPILSWRRPVSNQAFLVRRPLSDPVLRLYAPYIFKNRAFSPQLTYDKSL